MSEEQLLENKKNKPKVIYFYKELFRYNLWKDLRLFRKWRWKSGRNTIKPIEKPWFTYFIKFNPATYLTQVKIPLAINGGLDFQVPAKDNLAAIKISTTSKK
jgi:hypothetical protein